EVHIGRLRRKVDGEDEEQMIHTVRGAGYVLRSPE
ncbi:MAG: Transcriptional regulator, partial [Pseudomonas sp.]|nr:Transcriptional regulator [Pseudomonas sp.]